MGNLNVLFYSQEAITNTENTEMSPYSPIPEAHALNLKKMKVGAKVSVKQVTETDAGVFPQPYALLSVQSEPGKFQ